MMEESTQIEDLNLYVRNATISDFQQFLSDLSLPKLKTLDITLAGDTNMRNLIELGMLRDIPSFHIHVQRLIISRDK